MPSTTTQTREIQINKRQKEETVQKDNEPQSVFSSSWDDDFNKLHGRLLTNFHLDQDNFWPVKSDSSFYQTMTCSDNSVQVKNEGDVFQVTVESADFKPEELKVSTLNDNLLKIEGRHVEEGSLENGNKYVSRQFSRSYTLPANCKVHEMKSSFGNGKLVVTVPKTKPAIQDKSRKSTKENMSGSVRSIPIQSQQKSFYNSDAYKTKEVNIDSDLELDETAANTAVNSTSLEWPDLDSNNIFKSKFDNWKLGNSAFSDWIRPIQLFDEDFFMDRPDSFFNKTTTGDLKVTRSASKVDVKETDDQFQFILPTDDYDPKELKVSVLDDVLKIEGQHVEEDSDDRGKDGSSKVKKRQVTKQFSRSYVLPKHIYKMDQVESSLNTRQKKLVVKVPKIKPEKQLGGRHAVNVPIKML